MIANARDRDLRQERMTNRGDRDDSDALQERMLVLCRANLISEEDIAEAVAKPPQG